MAINADMGARIFTLFDSEMKLAVATTIVVWWYYREFQHGPGL